MNRLKEQDNHEKKQKNIALESSNQKTSDSDEETTKISDNENLNLLVKKFGKFLKRKYKDKGNKRGSIKKEMIMVALIALHVIIVGTQGHIKIEFLTLIKAKRKMLRRYRRISQRRKKHT